MRRGIDISQMREALRGPGIDTRVWIAAARIDDDPDAVVWDDEVGWIVDVSVLGGELDQETEIPTQICSSFAFGGFTRSDPPRRGAEVVVAMIEGDPNIAPVILGYTHNSDDAKPPAEVNGTKIDEAYALGHHILVTDHGLDEQYGGNYRKNIAKSESRKVDGDRTVDVAGTHQMLGVLVELADAGASQSFIRGDEFMTGLVSYLSQLSAWVSLTGAALAPLIPDPAKTAYTEATTLIAQQTADFSSQLSSYLSQKIKGE